MADPQSEAARPGEPYHRPPGGDVTPVQGTLRGVVRTGRAVGHAGAATGRWFVRSTRAEGAGNSGLASLIDLHTIQSAGDAMLTVALANTLFFSVDVHQARSRVAVYLLVTMAPFALIAPVVGPLLDRFRHGRRLALAGTLVVRAFLAWVLAEAVASKGGFELYPAAFGALVCSKAYAVSRGAVVPRVLPPTFTLVRGNARLTLWGILGGTVAAPIAQGISWASGGPSVALRITALVYLTGSGFAFRLPARVDSSQGESSVRRRRRRAEAEVDDFGGPDAYGEPSRAGHPRHQPPPAAARRLMPPLRGIGPRFPTMLRANAGLRAFSGFLTLFLAFLIRTKPLGVFSPNIDLGIVVAAAAVGSMLGTTIGAWIKSLRPEPLVLMALAAVALTGVLAAIWFGLVTAAAALLTANLSQSIGKLGLDSVIQRDVMEAVRTSAFARSETALQLSWVLGGFLAIVLPSNGSLGLALGSAVAATLLVVTLTSLRRISPERGLELLREQRTAHSGRG